MYACITQSPETSAQAGCFGDCIHDLTQHFLQAASKPAPASVPILDSAYFSWVLWLSRQNTSTHSEHQHIEGTTSDAGAAWRETEHAHDAQRQEPEAGEAETRSKDAPWLETPSSEAFTIQRQQGCHLLGHIHSSAPTPRRLFQGFPSLFLSSKPCSRLDLRVAQPRTGFFSSGDTLQVAGSIPLLCHGEQGTGTELAAAEQGPCAR